jgi:hypothetical protein
MERKTKAKTARRKKPVRSGTQPVQNSTVRRHSVALSVCPHRCTEQISGVSVRSRQIVLIEVQEEEGGCGMAAKKEPRRAAGATRASALLVLVGLLSGLASRSALCGPQTNLLTPTPPLPHCGEIESPPFANPHDAGARVCPPPSARNYTPHHKGLGFDILDSESEACFVPDQEYQLLDQLIDGIAQTVHYDPHLTDPQDRLNQARAVSKAISHELTRRGFALYIPTDTLSDALINRNQPSEPERHVFDCDTGSFIFITMAQNLGASISLVDITLPSGNGHNYVQWRLDEQGMSMNWDTNQQGECRTPPNLPGYQGKPMSADATRGYTLALRAGLWSKRGDFDRALEDDRSAMRLYSQAPIGYNNFAWLIATKEFPNRKELLPEALRNANHAVSLNRLPNYLDTLACLRALGGNFDQAVNVETEATAHSSQQSFADNLARFRDHQDCTGEE